MITEVLISAGKRAIALRMFYGEKLYKTLVLTIKRDENQDYNRAVLLGIKYALLAVKDKHTELRLFVPHVGYKVLNQGMIIKRHAELIAEIKELLKQYDSVVTDYGRRHPEWKNVVELPLSKLTKGGSAPEPD